jgi:hypothetical protein
MALSIDEANSVSSKYFDQTITSQVYEQSPYYNKLKQNGKVTWSGGVKIQWPMRYIELGRTQRTGPRAQLVYSPKETRTACELDWTYYYGHAMVNWDERVKNSGKAQIIDLMKDKTEDLNDDVYEQFSDDLFATTQVADALQSLDTIINTTAYAGVISTDAAPWLSTVDTTTTRLVLYGSSTCLAARINDCTFGSSKPSLIVTTRDLFNKAESLIEPQMRYEGTSTGDIGFTTVKFHGIPIVGDVKCTAAYMYLIDVDKYELRYHPDFNFKVLPWTALEQAGFPNAMVKVVSWAGNHVCRMRQTSGKYTALDFTQ